MASASLHCGEAEEQQRKNKLALRRKQRISEEAFSIVVFHRSTEASSSALNGDFLWFQLFIEVLLRMYDHELAKEDLICFARQYYANDQVESRKIDEFSIDYTADIAIKWYTRDCFIYRLLNQALRTRDMNILYTMRLLIMDIYLQLNKMKNANKNLPNIIHLYRGQAISHNEIEQLMLSVGNYVSMNSFLSTSADQQTSLIFAEAPDGYESVLFDIQVDTKLANVKPFACISMVSYFESEDETLFMLGAVFRLSTVKFDQNKRIWVVQMELCSDDESEIKPALENLKENIDDETNSYELARIMCEIGDTTAAERLIKRFIEKETPNQATMGCCYTLLGIIETKRGNLDEAISYHLQGLTLKQQHLPPDHIYIPYSHNSLGLALKESGRLDEALEQFNQALDLWRRQYESGIHENIAMCFHNIGMIYAIQDNIELATNNFSRAYEMLCICLSSIHPRTATTLKCIGSLYGNSGNFVMAQKILEKVLDIQRCCLPTTHVDVADTLYSIGKTYFNSNRFDQALNYYKEALGILRQTLPSTHSMCLEIEQDIIEVETILTK